MARTKKSIVLCHGIWADGSCFNKVIPTLQAEGFEVMSAQYGLDTNEFDVASVKRTLGRVSSPAILVGHSYGGSVITAAGTDERVVGLVYIAALAPDAGETSQSLLDQFPVSDVFSHIEVADGRVWMKPEGVACFRRRLVRPGAKRSFWLPTSLRRRTCSPRMPPALPGSRSRAGTSSPRRTAPSRPSCNASSRSAWWPPFTKSPAATCRCCPTAGVLVEHVYTQIGSYTVQVTATDKDGTVSVAATHDVNITGIALQVDPLDPAKTVLAVGG